LIRDPDNYENWVQRFSAGFSIHVGFGKATETGKESYIQTLIEILRELERCASPGAYLVDSLPILMYLPEWLTPFKKQGRSLQERERNFYLKLQSEVQDQIQKGVAPPSFSRTFLENQDKYDMTHIEGAHALGSMYEAGAGTVAAAVLSAILAMCLHPGWLRKMQDKIDRVVGDDRMPTFDDIPELPIVRAFYKETLRWRPVTAGGFPHRLMKDDVYEGYFIPEGVNVHGNIW
jgi:cytochrome P450